MLLHLQLPSAWKSILLDLEDTELPDGLPQIKRHWWKGLPLWIIASKLFLILSIGQLRISCVSGQLTFFNWYQSYFHSKASLSLSQCDRNFSISFWASINFAIIRVHSSLVWRSFVHNFLIWSPKKKNSLSSKTRICYFLFLSNEFRFRSLLSRTKKRVLRNKIMWHASVLCVNSTTWWETPISSYDLALLSTVLTLPPRSFAQLFCRKYGAALNDWSGRSPSTWVYVTKRTHFSKSPPRHLCGESIHQDQPAIFNRPCLFITTSLTKNKVKWHRITSLVLRRLLRSEFVLFRISPEF